MYETLGNTVSCIYVPTLHHFPVLVLLMHVTLEVINSQDAVSFVDVVDTETEICLSKTAPDALMHTENNPVSLAVYIACANPTCTAAKNRNQLLI